MKKSTIPALIILMLSLALAACGGTDAGEITRTPPISQASEPTAAPIEPTAIPPTATAEPTEVEPTVAEPTEASEIAEAPATPTAQAPQPLEENLVQSISLVEVANGFQKPIFVTHAGDKRLFVVEQDGRILVVQDGATLAEPFLDIDGIVGSERSEQGLLSVAFHPNYLENGYFFVYYTNNGGNVIIARYSVSADPNVADANSELRLLTVNQPFANHNGGQLHFGVDGYLYIGLGDGGSGGDPQGHGLNPATLLGSILRIDVDNGETYAVPSDNPFVNDDEKRNEIWAWGLRNPWRFSFDRVSADMFIADVGQNQWEEVSFQPANSSGGENYGWNAWEGTNCYNDLCNSVTGVLPIVEYDHAFGCSITGGYVYRGNNQRSLWGNYFYGDFCTGTIWATVQGDGAWPVATVAQSGLNISSFGEDANGELYVVHHGGAVYRIEQTATSGSQ